MKIPHFLLVVALLFATLFSTAQAQQTLKAKGLIVYKDPLTDYVEVLEFHDFVDNQNQQPAPPYSVLVDLHNVRATIKNTGIMGVVYYPQPPYGAAFQSMYDTETKLIRSLITKYPQQRERLEAALNLWQKALDASKKTQAAPTATPAAAQ